MDETRPAAPAQGLSFAELVALTAAVMALNALAIDMMLPALGAIAEDFVVAHANDRQLIVVVYIIANGVAQLFLGPLTDRFGRRPVLLASLVAYAAGSALSLLAPTFTLLIAARIFQGAATAGARVAIVAMVRDRYAGPQMARAMSIAVTVFMAAPIFAPAIGQTILAVAPWQGIFAALFLYGACILVWAFARARESLPESARRSIRPRAILASYGEFLSHRAALGYAAVQSLMFGVVFALISSSQQIYVDRFGFGALFPLAFAMTGVAFGIGGLMNSKIVGKVALRTIVRRALTAFCALQGLHIGAAALFGDTGFLFVGFMMATFFAIGFVTANAQALALEPVGHIAGAATAASGFATGAVGGAIGGLAGRLYNGTTTPLLASIAILGAASFLIARWADRTAAPAPSAEAAS